MRQTPSEEEIKQAIIRAQSARERLRGLRYAYRRRSSPGGVRQEVIKAALKDTRFTAVTLRRYIGMTPYHSALEPWDDEIRSVLRSLARERTQLRKMLR